MKPPRTVAGQETESRSDDPEIRRAVRRTVGIAALRRIRRLVDADNALEAEKARWARRIGILLLAAAIAAVAWIAIR